MTKTTDLDWFEEDGLRVLIGQVELHALVDGGQARFDVFVCLRHYVVQLLWCCKWLLSQSDTLYSLLSLHTNDYLSLVKTYQTLRNISKCQLSSEMKFINDSHHTVIMNKKNHILHQVYKTLNYFISKHCEKRKLKKAKLMKETKTIVKTYSKQYTMK